MRDFETRVNDISLNATAEGSNGWVQELYEQQRLPEGKEPNVAAGDFQKHMNATQEGRYDNIFWPLDESFPYSVTDTSGGGKVFSANDKVLGITYPDGTSRQFAYDDNGTLSAVKQPNGVVWLRDTDRADWISTQGRKFKGLIGVNHDGEYFFSSSDGEERLKKSDGTTEQKASEQAVSQGMKSVFKKADSNSDGYLSSREIDLAFTDYTGSARFRSEEFQALAIMKKHYDTLLNLNAPDNLLAARLVMQNEKGISHNDLARFDQLMNIKAEGGIGKMAQDQAIAQGAAVAHNYLLGVIPNLVALKLPILKDARFTFGLCTASSALLAGVKTNQEAPRRANQAVDLFNDLSAGKSTRI